MDDFIIPENPYEIMTWSDTDKHKKLECLNNKLEVRGTHSSFASILLEP